MFAWLGLAATLTGLAVVRGDETLGHRLPTIYLIGDSTVRTGTKGQQGWGDPFITLCDSSKVRVENRACGGRSSRTYLTEGLWNQVRDQLRPGDVVLIQFGHNDGGPLVGGRARASLKGNGEETREVVDTKTGKAEVVHTYGWYLRRYITEAKAKGAAPVVCSLVPRNIWDSGGKVRRASADYGRWAAEAAHQGGAFFIDLNERVAERYEADGTEVVKTRYFGTDHTHTTEAGARVTAEIVARSLQGLDLPTLRGAFRTATKATDAGRSTRPGAAAYRFDFGPGAAAPGFVAVSPETAFHADRGYGFEPGPRVEGFDRGGDDLLRGDLCTGSAPFAFSVAVPEGNYRVTLTLGDRELGSETSVLAEARRLMLDRVRTEPGRFVTRTFAVHIRTPRIDDHREVRLKPRELGIRDWDDKLTLEFAGDRPCIAAAEIVRADDAVTMYLLGDSTVADQTSPPWNSWGQMIPRFFGPDLAIANHAESGESLRSARRAGRLDKVLSTIRPGDFLLIQFGHNDQKEKGENVGAMTTYLADLKSYVEAGIGRGARPILVTPMHRRRFDARGKVVNSLGDYPEAVRRAAREEGVPLIDLNVMSRALYEALGPEGSASAFVDGTHHNAFGSYELARCVVEAIRSNAMPPARYLVEGVSPFDPTHPDRPEVLRLGRHSRSPSSTFLSFVNPLSYRRSSIRSPLHDHSSSRFHVD